MDTTLRDDISAKFCVLLTQHLPCEDDNKNSVSSISSRRIDSSPAEMLLFVAEVAEIVYEVFPLPKTTYPKTVLRNVAYAVKHELLPIDFEYNAETEDRLVLYWASILRVMSAFRVTRGEYALDAKALEEMGNTFEELKAHTLRYNLCSYERVKEYIDGKN